MTYKHTKKISPVPQPERNKEIYLMKKSGMSYKIIAAKYEISIARVFQIFKEHERREHIKQFWEGIGNIYIKV